MTAARDTRDERIGWIVFDQPQRHNAISVEMWREIPRAAEALAADDAVRVVVLRGAGDAAFVAGADISEFGEKRSLVTPEDGCGTPSRTGTEPSQRRAR